MSNVWGKNIKLSIFGESHGEAIGMMLSGLPPGYAIDWGEVGREMDRRAPGKSDLSTPRKESDRWEVLSGVFEGKTTGSPLAIIIRNENTVSKDYDRYLARPGHADITAYYKYKGCADYRGGGHFSGRLTAPLVLAGAIARQMLPGIEIGARIAKIKDFCDLPVSAESIPEISRQQFPVSDENAAEAMRQVILTAKSENDSVGGVIECVALGVPIGLGDPFFDSLESAIASMMFSVPAVKGIEFGDGFGMAAMTGSQANDQLYMENGEIKYSENRSGGINGGISNGQPLVFRVAVRPTPTIGKHQSTVRLDTKETVTASFGGRHDPCIVPRAVPVVEAGLALCLLDYMIERRDNK